MNFQRPTTHLVELSAQRVARLLVERLRAGGHIEQGHTAGAQRGLELGQESRAHKGLKGEEGGFMFKSETRMADDTGLHGIGHTKH